MCPLLNISLHPETTLSLRLLCLLQMCLTALCLSQMFLIDSESKIHWTQQLDFSKSEVNYKIDFFIFTALCTISFLLNEVRTKWDKHNEKYLFSLLVFNFY